MRSRRGPRLVADRSPTSFSDSHAPILTKLVGDRSATSRRLIGDWSATLPGLVCDQISRSQVFVQAQKPGCDWFGRNEVPDQSPTSLQPRRDRSGTLLRPLRLVWIVSRGEVAKRLQRMSDWGFNDTTFFNFAIPLYVLDKKLFNVNHFLVHSKSILAPKPCWKCYNIIDNTMTIINKSIGWNITVIISLSLKLVRTCT